MKRTLTAALPLLPFLLTGISLPALAQQAPMDPGAPSDAAQAQQPPAYTTEQIDQLLAPVALYPDALLSQVLMAATYPLEVVQADRWLQDPNNAALQGDQLAAALEQQPWDPSVKSLVPLPQVLKMMDSNLQWTEQLGDAFLAQQPQVMDSVQHLRAQAQAAGNLKTTPQQTVTTQDQDIVIQPANPQVVYVPYYNPQVVYGAWPYPDYEPYYFPPPPGYAVDGAFIGFGIGLAVLAPFWGWDHWDWHRHNIVIDDGRFERINRGRAPSFSGDAWRHDPVHRHGVPYNSAATRAKFQHTSEDARRNYRGFGATSAATRGGVMNPRTQAETHNTAETRHINPMPQQRAETPHTGNRVETPRAAETPRVENRVEAPRAVETPRAAETPRVENRVEAPRAVETPRVENRVEAPRAAPAPERAGAPIFESMPRGAQTRESAVRGAESRAPARAEAPRAAPARAETPRAENRGGGNEKHR